MRTPRQAAIRTGAFLFAMLMVLADVSGGLMTHPVHATPVAEFEAPILVEGLPPLMCGEEHCERPTRMIERGERPSAEPDQWWLGYGPDLDWNGMDDRLQRARWRAVRFFHSDHGT